MLLTIFESIMIVTALSMDAFVASFAYGANRVKIPFSSVTVINVICSSILAISLFFGTIIGNFIPENITHIICFLILFVLGIMKLGESLSVWFVKNHKYPRYINLSFWSLDLEIIVRTNYNDDPTPNFKVLGIKEAVSLSIALSLDGLAVGFGAALANANATQIVAFSLISDMLAVMLGCFIGRKLAEKISINLSWLSGIMLTILAVMKLS